MAISDNQGVKMAETGGERGVQVEIAAALGLNRSTICWDLAGFVREALKMSRAGQSRRISPARE